jgi:hypothetical protein
MDGYPLEKAGNTRPGSWSFNILCGGKKLKKL